MSDSGSSSAIASGSTSKPAASNSIEATDNAEPEDKTKAVSDLLADNAFDNEGMVTAFELQVFPGYMY